jgi:hypothetical protein
MGQERALKYAPRRLVAELLALVPVMTDMRPSAGVLPKAIQNNNARQKNFAKDVMVRGRAQGLVPPHLPCLSLLTKNLRLRVA